jgi:hypothetical protein
VVSGVIDTADHQKYLREYKAICKKALTRVSGAQMELFDGKNRRSKISWQGPFNKTDSHFDYLCSAPDYNLVSWAEHCFYSVLIPAFQVSCVPILWCLIGILCANTRFNRIERKVMYAIAPHRIPIDTCDWHTGHHCYPVCQLPNRLKIFLAALRQKWYPVCQLLFIDRDHSSIITRMRWHTGF